MARVMSFVMTVFILIPMIAPTLGQAILLFSGWRSIFGSFVLMALITLVWFGLRIPETLAPENRAPFTLRRIMDTTLEIVRNRTALGYTVSAGLVSGAFLGYLNSTQQIFQEQYALGARFPALFCGDLDLSRPGVLHQRKPGDALWYAFPDSMVAFHHCRAFDPCLCDWCAHCRTTTPMDIYGLSHADLFLYRRTVWKPERPGDGAVGTPGRHGRCGGGFALHPDINAAGHRDRSKLQRHSPPTGDRNRGALWFIYFCRPLGRI